MLVIDLSQMFGSATGGCFGDATTPRVVMTLIASYRTPRTDRMERTATFYVDLYNDGTMHIETYTSTTYHYGRSMTFEEFITLSTHADGVESLTRSTQISVSCPFHGSHLYAQTYQDYNILPFDLVTLADYADMQSDGIEFTCDFEQRVVIVDMSTVPQDEATSYDNTAAVPPMRDEYAALFANRV